jgi:hypothetical protein
MVSPTTLSKSAQPCSPQVTYMQECEARDWRQRYKAKMIELGQVRARNWWESVKADIERKRGKDGLDILINNMNRQRHDDNSL